MPITINFTFDLLVVAAVVGIYFAVGFVIAVSVSYFHFGNNPYYLNRPGERVKAVIRRLPSLVLPALVFPYALFADLPQIIAVRKRRAAAANA